MSRFRDWLKAIDKGFASFTLFPKLEPRVKEAPPGPPEPQAKGNNADLYPPDLREAIEDTVYPQTDEKDVEDIPLLCHYPDEPCTCKNGIGCVNVPVEKW